MKSKIFLSAIMFGLVLSTQVKADELDEPMCKVRVCNKIERFSLDIFSHMKDSMGETCHDVVMPKSEIGVGVGQVLSSESRWYQGSSINPTKKSVTRIDHIYRCKE